MIHFFKQKPYLLDFISEDFVDIHSHLLPGIDDGSKNLKDTTKLIIEMEDLGFKKFITTPHVMSDVWNNPSSLIKENEINTIKELKIPLIKEKLKAAAEYMVDESFRQLFTNEPLLTLRDKYVLIEISYLNPPIQLYDILKELQSHGYRPVLAHPERYNFYHNSLSEYRKLKKAGCYFQVNMLSANGYYGVNVSKTVDYLLEKGYIDFIGSDIHHSKHIENLNKRVVLKNHQYLSTIFQNNSFFDF